ncbi:hypothetical protein AA103196_0830 [Ameyamaea chiangmaiensis NBRC 103196]|uniref:DUF2975 domain-containing protein n=2 Tax=Acetobacteraceae TaxID=433 RepID=A0A850P4M2_9PROT|nr:MULTISPECIES: DUF2975 domain-containing protein [Acetobacteraceae]KXV10946.1 hypothetical protein AD930_00585 [Acetobacter malorum]MBS4076521.1 DUF2975 domain-containing protein [Ameyamaea chiangmaiensis]NVN39587.1 DUF2975 domain-containing protein [Ameyamaea chiangmaiensis]GBQ64305.1 hypothetical protein AA103196_0830 [Ameyamaea chiangmaiensis NBRC 103196]GBQ78629.1 hypothetical protein AA14337_1214 [Acetobacter malorum DSM 14337]
MTVLPFARPEDDEPLPSPPVQEAERRLASYARSLRALFFGSLAVSGTLVAVGSAALALRSGAYVVAGIVNHRLTFMGMIGAPAAGMTSQDFIPASQLSMWATSLGACLLVLRFLPGLLVLTFLYRLFNLYAKGEVFTFATTREIRNISCSVLAYSCISLVTHPLMYLLGLFPEIFSWDMQQIDALVLGIILLAVTYVMKIGNRIQEEQKDYI